jgi:twitching motility protein PilT
MDIKELLQIVVSRNASDLHLLVGQPPILRVDGELVALPSKDRLTPETSKQLIFSILTDQQKEILEANREVDFSYEYDDGARFRVNAYSQKNSWAAALRYLPMVIRNVEQLSLPKICHQFTTIRQGFVLVTGPTGHGKSTTLAAMINEINLARSEHIVTIEDPVEYIYPTGKSVISQREMHYDTHSWDVALRSVLREDPDVVLIGEMRDYETISSAITIAETGHLVFATLHTNDAAQTVDRIVDVFPENQQAQVRLQLSNVLEGVISQRLVPRLKGGRIPAAEILLGTAAVKNAIREGKSHQIPNIIQTSGGLGMVSLERSLADWVHKGEISLETATDYSLRPEEITRLVRSAHG